MSKPDKSALPKTNLIPFTLTGNFEMVSGTDGVVDAIEFFKELLDKAREQASAELRFKLPSSEVVLN